MPDGVERQFKPNDIEHDFGSGGLNNGKVKPARGYSELDCIEVGLDFDDFELK